MAVAAELKYLLLQVRKPQDPMRQHEIDCFARELGCPTANILVHDLIHREIDLAQFARVDAVLIGGSGDYSVAVGGPWLPAALDAFEYLYETSKPTFASCWGFQAFARAMGGRVVTDIGRAELGTLTLRLTPAGTQDALFSPLGTPFLAQLGHQDIVDELPGEAVLLASSDKVENEAFTFPGKPIYATQFHPELSRSDLLQRMQAYPEYLQKITGLTFLEFQRECSESPATAALLQRFANSLVSEA